MRQATFRSSSAVRCWLTTHPLTLAGVLLLAALSVPFCLRKHSEWEEVYLRAAVQMRAGEAVYGPGQSYLYPPFLAWLAVPFTALTSLEARIAWYGINAVSLVLLLRWSWRLAGGGSLEGERPVKRPEYLIGLLGLACAVYYALDCLTNHKCDLILGALMLEGCVVLGQGRSLAAATLFGLAAGLRCTPLLWAPYLAWRRQWLAAGWVAVVAVGVNLLPNLTCPPAAGGTWAGEWLTRYLVPLGDAGRAPGEWGSEIKYNQSLSGAANRWLLADGSRDRPGAISPDLLRNAILGGELALLLAALLVIGRRPVSRAEQTEPLRAALEYSVILLLMLLLSPMSSKTHYCVLFLPGFCVARLALERRDRLLGLLLAAAIAAGLLSNKDLWGEPLYTLALWYGSVTWAAVWLLIGCGYALAKTKDEGMTDDETPVTEESGGMPP